MVSLHKHVGNINIALAIPNSSTKVYFAAIRPLKQCKKQWKMRCKDLVSFRWNTQRSGIPRNIYASEMQRYHKNE